MPEDIELNGDEATFKIVVSYDTRGLFGDITGEKEFAIAR